MAKELEDNCITERPMDTLFKTYQIKFKDRDDFNAAMDGDTLSDDIGHSDMVLAYSCKSSRDSAAGYLRSIEIDKFDCID